MPHTHHIHISRDRFVMTSYVCKQLNKHNVYATTHTTHTYTSHTTRTQQTPTHMHTHKHIPHKQTHTTQTNTYHTNKHTPTQRYTYTEPDTNKQTQADTHPLTHTHVFKWNSFTWPFIWPWPYFEGHRGQTRGLIEVFQIKILIYTKNIGVLLPFYIDHPS